MSLKWDDEKGLIGDFSRRGLLKGMSAAGLASIALPFGSANAAGEPKKGGRFRMALPDGSTTDSLDPALVNAHFAVSLSWQLRNNLLEIAPNGELVGELAESWEPSSGGGVWTFTLRRGVEFHNGKTLDAADVVASFNHHRGDASKSGAKSFLVSVKDIAADGKNKVVFTLDSPNADFPYICTDYRFTISPAKPEGGIDWVSGVGTGGYILKRFEPGISSLVARNPNYWKAGHAHFDEVETFSVVDVAARTSGLRTGRFDVIHSPDAKTATLLGKVPGLRLITTTGNRHAVWAMKTTASPFDNNDVRLALKYAVDRNQMVSTVFSGLASVGNDSPIGKANRYAATAEELPQRAYDPEKAKFHLQKAGLSNLKVSLSVAATVFPGAVDAAVLFRESAARAGIDLAVTREPDDGYWANVWLKRDFCAGHWSGRPTEDSMFSLAYASKAPNNETAWSNEKFDKLLVQARGELDDNKRREIYVDMQRIVHNEGGALIPAFLSFTAGASSKVGMSETIGNNFPLDGLRAAERWWFA